MNEHEDDHRSTDAPATAIGVGMGGSCPQCRAPVDLGQEFCLECGAPIRFSARTKRAQARADRPAPSSRPDTRGGGFPWIPFIVVLALLGGGIALALVDGGRSSSGSSQSQSTESALPSITSERPTVDTSSTQTTTLQDCNPSTPLGTDTSGATDSSQTIPELDSGASTDQQGSGFESSSPGSGDTANPVTVDQFGNVCPGATSTETTQTQPAASGDWPAGRSGWTVIVYGYTSRDRATQSAADLRDDGFSDGGVLWSSDFVSLCPGFYVVFSGVFDTEAGAAKRKQDLVAKDYAGMFVREVRTDGARATGCRTVSSST